MGVNNILKNRALSELPEPIPLDRAVNEYPKNPNPNQNRIRLRLKGFYPKNYSRIINNYPNINENENETDILVSTPFKIRSGAISV